MSNNSEGNNSEENYENDNVNQPSKKNMFTCSSSSSKTIYDLLVCLSNNKKGQHTYCEIDEQGMSFTVHSKAKTMQIKTVLDAALFHSYVYSIESNDCHDNSDADGNDTELNESSEYQNCNFNICLSTILDCLNVFGSAQLSNTSVSMTYIPDNAVFSIILEESGILTECELHVIAFDYNEEFHAGSFEKSFESNPVVAKTIIKSECLLDAFSELSDLPSATCVGFNMSPPNPMLAAEAQKSQEKAPLITNELNEKLNSCFCLSARGDANQCEICFRCTSSAFVEFSCVQECFASYHLIALQQAMKALGISTETFIRMNSDGILSVQHMIETIDGNRCFIDALVNAEEE